MIRYAWGKPVPRSRLARSSTPVGMFLFPLGIGQIAAQVGTSEVSDVSFSHESLRQEERNDDSSDTGVVLMLTSRVGISFTYIEYVNSSLLRVASRFLHRSTLTHASALLHKNKEQNSHWY